ncbi:unnamed protein product, partial [Discosporangium mesarthrocarpum]
FIQISASLPVVLKIQFPANFMTFLASLDLLNMSIVKALGLGCLFNGNFHSELIFKTMAPLAVAVAIWCIFVVSLWQSPCSNKKGGSGSSGRVLCKSFLSYFMWLSYFALVPASNTILQTFFCESFDDGRTLLQADYSIDCDSEEHGQYRLYAVAMVLVYPVGIPTLYTVILFKSRRSLYP